MTITTIRLKKETVEKLKEIGKKGETYDQIVNRLIEPLLKQLKQEVQEKETRQ